MTLPFILLAFGLLFIFLEFYLPGAIMGTIGVFVLLAAVVIFLVQGHSLLASFSFVVGTVVLVSFLIWYVLRRIPLTKPEYSIYSDKDQEGFQASAYDATAIGKKGIVLSDLRPGGYILVENKKHQALSKSGYIAKGGDVIVIGGEEESLIVKANF